MIAVDTNILIYAVDRSAFGHVVCRQLLQSLQSGGTDWFLTWGVVYEFLRVTTHPKVFRTPLSGPAAFGYLRTLLASPNAKVLEETNRHSEFLGKTLEEVPDLAGNILFDVHTDVLLREHGVRRIYTRDAHFRRFSFLEPIDPTE